MPLDGLFIRALTQNLDSELRDTRIDKIHQPEKLDLVFHIRKKNGNSRLLLSANARWARFHLTNHRLENPTSPPAFCMYLRKHLEGARIIDLRQPGWERVLYIRILALNEFRDWSERLLIGEFMGRHSNIILVDPNTGLIMDAIKRYGNEVSTYREVLPGRPYVPPPSQNKLLPEAATPELLWSKWCQGSLDLRLSQALFSAVEGLSPISAAFICERAGLPALATVGECGEYELNQVYRALKSIVDTITSGQIQPAVSPQRPPSDFWLLPLDTDWKPAVDANNAVDEYYNGRLAAARLESFKVNINRNITGYLNKLYRKRLAQEQDLAEARQKEHLRNWGELLTAYAHEVPPRASAVQLTDFYSGEPVTIELQPHLNAIQNAQKYFKTYAKARVSRDHLQTFLAQTKAEIDYLESVQVALERAESVDEAEEIIEELTEQKYMKESRKNRKRAHAETNFRQFTSSDGLTILVGRNNRQNDILTLRKAAAGDLWLHTKEIPGTHVILRLNSNDTDI
ncbi:MAG: NFACT family protein, partial [Methylocystaceae bacterium]